MKNIYSSVILLICSLGFVEAQTDYCKDIKKTVDKTKSYIEYESPISFLQISTFVLDDGTKQTDLTFTTTMKTADYDAYGLYVFFADGSMWKYTSGHIDCSYLNAEFGYQYIGTSLMEDDALLPFKTKKIVKVQIKDVEIPVTDEFATKFMAYVNCIDALKQ